MSAKVRVAPAIAFVREKGKPRDRALLKVLLGEPLSDADLEVVRENQNPDGGFRVPELGVPTSVVGRTAEMLLYFAALGAADFGCAQAAADFLIEAQRPDGTWGEAESLSAASPPLYFRPGSDDVIAWETATAILALTGMGLALDFRAPLQWILHHRIHTRGGRLFRIETIMEQLAFTRQEGPESEGASRLNSEVQTISSKDLEVFELNFALLGSRAAGVGLEAVSVRAFGEALVKHQGDDGGFGTGPASSGFETVLALCSLEHAGLAALPRTNAAADHSADPAKSDHGI
jgi:hypothetical protein